MRLHFKKDHVLIMGILNITPDSFSDGGLYFENTEKSVARAREMLDEGADIIDIGGESTRPGAKAVSKEEELRRVIPVVIALRKTFGSNFIISIDTYKAAVAKEALTRGANMVNSIGGMRFDKTMPAVIKEFRSPFVIYHIKGLPRTMQKGEILYKDVVKDIMRFFEQQIAFGMKEGIKREQFIVDPGIGFGKTVAHNIEIIKRLGEFKKLELPILIGVSRKGHLGTLLKENLSLREVPSPEERLEASLAETAITVLNGANIVRTHDVRQTKRFLTVLEAVQKIQ